MQILDSTAWTAKSGDFEVAASANCYYGNTGDYRKQQLVSRIGNWIPESCRFPLLQTAIMDILEIRGSGNWIPEAAAWFRMRQHVHY